ncbi:50S ribosomal protein L16 [Candidatus Woesearchaeota archaeon]|nr:50S ribosomal protein L16 [Candidatus Woesearchaeota archaeon]
MAKLRKGVSYRNLERPYTRRSKYQKKNYVGASPHNLIVRYDMGELKRKFEYKLEVKSLDDLQIRHNALEAARKSSNRVLEKKTGKVGFRMKLRLFPHHILRENPLASGAGADRMSTGMAHSFGKPIGIAAQIRKGQVLFEIHVDKANIPVAKEAARRIKSKIPCRCQLVITKNE